MVKPWKFDKNLSEHFCDHARKHIPEYDSTIDLCVEVAKKRLGKHARIIDVGCATGETLRRFQGAGFTNLTGTDNSQAMIDKAIEKGCGTIDLILSDTFPDRDFDMVIANWTLHFIPEIPRQKYLQDIYNSLPSGGMLILTEKIAGSTILRNLYHDFKRRSGVSEQEIEAKERSLEGVLIPLPIHWYNEVLQEIGYEIEILKAVPSFVTFMCYKPLI